MLTKRKKANAVQDVQRHKEDTGSPESQSAILTKQIDELAKHLKKHPGDNHSRRGLLGMVASRQKHLTYIERKDPKKFKSLVKKLGLKSRA